MHRIRIAALFGAITLVGACSTDNFLTGGELSVDPNRPTEATAGQLFVGIQANTWALLASDPPRVTDMWTQQFIGTNQQYTAVYNYVVSEQTTNGFHAALYTGGGLVDIRRLQTQTVALHDSVFHGIAEIMEALVMGTGADLFGDLTYTHALTGELNPPLDPQMAVYDSVQALLSRAIVELKATGPSNTGPGDIDLAYGGDPVKWTKLAHTLKARFLMHTAEVRPTVYPQVVTEAAQGLTTADDNFNAVFSGAANEQNFWYQFDVVQRPGYLAPNPQFVSLLKTRSDPRLAKFFNADQSDLADALIDPAASQPLVTANESLLLWAEAAQRAGNDAAGLTRLNQARALAGLSAETALTGRPLLAEILTEAYIADFQSVEAWNLYKRTCTPNLTPVVAASKIPARFPYDAGERNTNTSIPALSQQPVRNANDPKNATSDATGAACVGQ
ncbi:MAG TPA: SusD/RagB family nutrient-binding outer membrane lipoprotein [Gemmatimonadaceae bacterium]|nr:SusD/RagB family nutrient-binding outer membrane lipoprotein [Gemmatimonadaceae bacterium]